MQIRRKTKKVKTRWWQARRIAKISNLAQGRARWLKERGKGKKKKVAKRNRVLADSSWVIKFIRAFVSAFGFTLRKKAWKEGKWVDAVCQRDAPARTNVFATYCYDYSSIHIYRFATCCNQPVQQWISLTLLRYEHAGESRCWHSHDWMGIYENFILQLQ